jgi:integrase
MPLKLVPPRQGQSPNWRIRGTHLGVYVDQSSGTDRRSVAREQLAELRGKIERREYPPAAPIVSPDRPTFLSAALAYLEAGRRRRYVANLIKHFGETPLPEIDQAAIDAAAVKLHPNVTPGARNAAVYTPVSAILRNSGVDLKLRRPKGAKGRVVTDWLVLDDAAAVIRAAESFDSELALLLTFLLYTGVRLGEAVRMTWEDIELEDATAWVRRSKGGPAGMLRLRGEISEGLAAHKSKATRRRVFRFHQGGHLKHLLTRAKLSALGLPCPRRRPKGWKAPVNRLAWVNFHTFRHTWATWMRRYGGLDEIGLKATGNWNDERSARRYAHAVAREEWSKVDLLPSIRTAKIG